MYVLYVLVTNPVYSFESLEFCLQHRRKLPRKLFPHQLAKTFGKICTPKSGSVCFLIRLSQLTHLWHVIFLARQTSTTFVSWSLSCHYARASEGSMRASLFAQHRMGQL